MAKVKGKARNWEIGNFNGNAIRKKPTVDRVMNFMNEMGPNMTDYDVYLWGSWPEKKNTWDVDFLLANENQDIQTKEMEDLVLKGLDTSLNKNNFLADIGFTNKEVVPFQKYWDHYNRTGNASMQDGYVYGPQWYADGHLIKDRTKFTNGLVQPLDDNMMRIMSGIPYSKMTNPGHYDKYYKNKPMLIKNRKKIYG